MNYFSSQDKMAFASVLQAARVILVRGPYYLGVGSISDSLSLSQAQFYAPYYEVANTN